MISEICPLAHQRYLSLPVLGAILDEFTEWALQQGYSFLTVWKELPFTVPHPVSWTQLCAPYHSCRRPLAIDLA